MSVESALKSVSDALGVAPQYLSRLINFESRFNPLASNPYSGARGLIQFTHQTAKEMGFSSADDLVSKYPDVESQLKGPVLKYLSRYAPFREPFPQSLYLSVFYPAYRFKPLDTLFSNDIRRLNPGIDRVGDYVAKVEKKSINIIQ